MVKSTVNIDTVVSMVKDVHPDMKIKDIRKVILSGLDATTSLLAKGHPVKLHKTMKLEPRVQDAHKSYDGLNKTYYSRPKKTYIKLTELTYLRQALDESDKES